MASYTAIVGDTSSVGMSGATAQPFSVSVNRRNPAAATARIRNVLDPHIIMDSVGGLLTCDFTIPPEEAERYRSVLRYGAVVWLFDGATPIFVGYADQPTWSIDGCLMNVSGPWILLQQSRMREVWDLWDMSMLQKGTGANENKAGQFTQNSDGTVTLGFPNGTVLAASDRCSVDYLLFGEPVGDHDQKLITAFEFDISDATGLSANRRLRVIGKANAATAAGDLLYDTGAAGSSSRQGALNLHGFNQGGAQWVSTTGYRCLRFEYIYTVGVTLSQDQYVTLDRIRVSTREALFPGPGGSIDTAAIARDVLTHTALAGTPSIQNFDLPQEFWLSLVGSDSPDSNTAAYVYGLDPLIGTGSAPDSGVGVTGYSALEWQSPADILSELAAIDGAHVGFYLPYNGRGGYDPAGSYLTGTPGSDVGSQWLTAPPQLFYQLFSDPVSSPDYTIHPQEGANVEPHIQGARLATAEYVNYQTLKGRQLSVVTEDATSQNYLYAQGFRRSDDMTIQPSVGDQTLAASMGQQALMQRRNPTTTATVTIENDGSERYPILKGGASIPRLATIRPGSARIVNAGAGLSSCWITHVEWWGHTINTPERVELALGPPGLPDPQVTQGKITHRARRTRHRKLV